MTVYTVLLHVHLLDVAALYHWKYFHCRWNMPRCQAYPIVWSSICVDNNENENQDRPVIKDRHPSGSEKSTGTVHVQGYCLQKLAHGGLTLTLRYQYLLWLCSVEMESISSWWHERTKKLGPWVICTWLLTLLGIKL